MVFRALTLARERFCFDRGMGPGVERTIRDSVPNLLLEGFRRLDRGEIENHGFVEAG